MRLEVENDLSGERKRFMWRQNNVKVSTPAGKMKKLKN